MADGRQPTDIGSPPQGPSTNVYYV